jgi:hypothetical protein
MDLDHPDEDPLTLLLGEVAALAATADRSIMEEPVLVPVVASTAPTITLNSETGLLNQPIRSHSESTFTSLDISSIHDFEPILDIPSTSTDPSMAFRTYSPILDHITGYTIEPESDTSSELQDFSDFLRGPSPPATSSSTTLATISSTTVASALNDAVDFNPDEFLLLLDQGPIYQEYVGTPTHTQVQVPLNLNTNPHSNSQENPEVEEEIEDNILPDIPPTVIEPPGQFHIGLYDLYAPKRESLKDLTNLAVTR